MLLSQKPAISAIVVAAGLSTRMGEPKQLLPYGQHAVIEQIVSVLQQCALLEVVVVIGHAREAIETKLATWPVRVIFNPNYQSGEMLSSIQCGLLALDGAAQAALVVLGDQPQLEATVVQQVIEAYQTGLGRLVIPSFQMRRGHPILLDRAYWPEILDLGPDEILRKVINAHTNEIHYVVVKTDAVLRDMDTPGEYQQELHRRVLKPPFTT